MLRRVRLVFGGSGLSWSTVGFGSLEYSFVRLWLIWSRYIRRRSLGGRRTSRLNRQRSGDACVVSYGGQRRWLIQWVRHWGQCQRNSVEATNPTGLFFVTRLRDHHGETLLLSLPQTELLARERTPLKRNHIDPPSRERRTEQQAQATWCLMGATAIMQYQAREEVWPHYVAMRDRVGRERGWPRLNLSSGSLFASRRRLNQLADRASSISTS